MSDVLPDDTQSLRRTSRAAPETLVTVGDLAQDLGISARALRFYEDKGLIVPRRVAATRVYSNRDRARMILILRGKRLGFSLREIKAYLDLYDADPQHEAQTTLLLARIAERRRQLEDQRVAIDAALTGLDDLERDARATRGDRQGCGRQTHATCTKLRDEPSSAAAGTGKQA